MSKRKITPESAMRDIVLLNLSELDGHSLASENGRASGELLKLCGLPADNRRLLLSVLRELEDDLLVAVERGDAKTRIYKIGLVSPLKHQTVRGLKGRLENNLAILAPETEASESDVAAEPAPASQADDESTPVTEPDGTDIVDTAVEIIRGLGQRNADLQEQVVALQTQGARDREQIARLKRFVDNYTAPL